MARFVIKLTTCKPSVVQAMESLGDLRRRAGFVESAIESFLRTSEGKRYVALALGQPIGSEAEKERPVPQKKQETLGKQRKGVASTEIVSAPKAEEKKAEGFVSFNMEDFL